MIYAISDIHGCYEEFKRLLNKIEFKAEDTLYVIGDIIDRGNDGMKILLYMMEQDNIIPLMGNHELMAMQVLPVLVGKKAEDIEFMMKNRIFMKNMALWNYNGGDCSIEEFLKLTKEEQQKIVDYIENFSMHLEIEADGQKILLIHSLPPEKDAYLHISDGTYTPMKLLFGRPEFDSPGLYSYENYKIIMGHTPTAAIPEAAAGEIFKCGSIIDIDCGCVSGHALCAYRINDDTPFYVDKI